MIALGLKQEVPAKSENERLNVCFDDISSNDEWITEKEDLILP